MPSFPGSVKVFTTKLDGAGNPINAAHVNDLQDEVNAIEAGYLDGSARLNSSQSTLASLSVSGGTTLAGSLSVTGGTTLAGTLQSSNSTVNALEVSSNSTFAFRPTMPPPDFALVFPETTGAMGSSGDSTVSFTGQAIAINSSFHSTATNPQRLTPQTTGLYALQAQVGLSSNSTGFRQILIEDSSAAVVGRTLLPAAISAMFVQVSAFKRFDVTGGYVTCRVNQTGASTLSITSGVQATWFSMRKL